MIGWVGCCDGVGGCCDGVGGCCDGVDAVMGRSPPPPPPPPQKDSNAQTLFSRGQFYATAKTQWVY